MCATQELSGRISRPDAVVAMPRRSCESAMADAIRALARRNAAFSRLASKLRSGSNGKGQVRFGSELAVSSMNAEIDSTATREATSPATWPPIPSATMNRPRSGRVEWLSSLLVRRRPASVRTAHESGIAGVMGDGCVSLSLRACVSVHPSGDRRAHGRTPAGASSISSGRPGPARNRARRPVR